MVVQTEGARLAARVLQRGQIDLGTLDARRRAHLLAAARTALHGLADRTGRFLTSGPLIRLVTRTLQRRIIFANLIGLVILLGGIFYLSQAHIWLIEAKRESLLAQGEIIAAAIAAEASVETDRIVLDPDKLPEVGAPILLPDPGFSALQLSIAPERVTRLMHRLLPGSDTRARVYDHDGILITDTAQRLQRGQLVGHAGPAARQERTKIRSSWTRLLSWLLSGELPVYREIASANGTAYPEVRMALSGSATPMLLVTDKGQQIVSVAVPIQNRKSGVQGVLLLSTRPGEIDEILSQEHNVVFVLAALAFAATLLASFLLARTIAGPMRRLSEAAENVSHNLNARRELPELADRADEVGQMGAAFHKMTEALYRRIETSERFAQDVAHELKNPLTAARSTVEAMAYAKSPAQHQELVGQIQDELNRLNRLISDVAEASRLDARMTFEGTEPVDLRAILLGVSDVFRDRPGAEHLRLKVEPPHHSAAYIVHGHEARLGRAITNVLDNALSFTPNGGAVTIGARRLASEIEIVVEDEGPGIPPGQFEAIFERFYSDRPLTDKRRGKNSGLGLSIARDIVKFYGGRIWASNRLLTPGAATPGGCEHESFKGQRAKGIIGARFVIRLPAADAVPAKGAMVLARRN